MRLLVAVCVFFWASSVSLSAKNYLLSSPDHAISLSVSVDTGVWWSVVCLEKEVLKPSRISLETVAGRLPAPGARVQKAEYSQVDATITADVPVKNRLIPEQYNQLRIRFAGGVSLVFRAYNDGVAYRFETALPDKELTIISETARFSFPPDARSVWPVVKSSMGMGAPGGGMPPAGGNMPPAGGGAPEGAMPMPPGGSMPAGMKGGMPQMKQNPFNHSFEYTYADSAVGEIRGTAGLPVYVALSSGIRAVLVEADLHDYPNLFVAGTGNNTLDAVFPHVVTDAGFQNPMFGNPKTADYIAKTTGTRTFPWRAVIISTEDRQLLESDLVYKLSTPPVIPTDWIKTGQVTWEWYNAANVFGVDFVSGINIPTYKYYIDFAAKYGIPYLLIDAGWQGNKEVDIPEIVRYGKERKVDIILWVAWTDMERDMEKTLDQYVAWGARGVKIDYMNRADQWMVNFYERMAAETAKRKLLLDFHGAYKPSGLNRTYPNVVNYEGVNGMEHNKLGSTDVTPAHDVTLPFTRMTAGPMDYTPGAMITVAKGNFRNITNEPMSQGTRAHQAAMYVMYDAPLQMLADNPSLYMREEPVIRFLTRIPTTWDRTIGLDGLVGQYAVIARKKGDTWYLGAMTDWNERELTFNLDFLDAGTYTIDIFADGINANKKGIDYTLTSSTVKKGETVTIAMKQGGGWVGILSPVK
jgi:alpha-glucosidase